MTLAAIFATVLAVGLLPFLFPRPPPAQETSSSRRPTRIPERAAPEERTVDVTPPPPPFNPPEIPELPPLSAITASPDLLARATELARENPDVPWLRQYVVNTHYWLGATLEGCLLASRYDCDVFYPSAASVVDYLVQVRSMGGVRDVLAHLGEGLNINDALQRVTGRDERGVIRDWEHFIRRRY